MSRNELDSNLPDLPAPVRERWPVAVARAARKTRSAVPNPAVGPLIKAAQKGSTATQRVIWRQRTASAWALPLPLPHVAACRRGCVHCCHIPVTISGTEAALIGRHLGQAPARPDRSVRLDAFADPADAVTALPALGTPLTPSPCPFLHGNVCGIHEVSPMACRLLLNLDDDDLLCRPVPGQEIPVPYGRQHPTQGLVPEGPVGDATGRHPGVLREARTRRRGTGWRRPGELRRSGRWVRAALDDPSAMARS